MFYNCENTRDFYGEYEERVLIFPRYKAKMDTRLTHPLELWDKLVDIRPTQWTLLKLFTILQLLQGGLVSP
jgi:hypothetical protein